MPNWKGGVLPPMPIPWPVPTRQGRNTAAPSNGHSSAHWFPEEVDYINACGLGTMELDLIETIGHQTRDGILRPTVSPSVPSSPRLGHAFAASGAFQLIGTVLALRHQFIPPTLHLTHPDPQCDLDYVAGVGRSHTIQRALVNSFGFGGKNIVIAVSGVETPVSSGLLIHEGMGAYHEPLATTAMARAEQAEQTAPAGPLVHWGTNRPRAAIQPGDGDVIITRDA